MIANDYDDLHAVLAAGLAPVVFGFSPWLAPDPIPWASGAAGSTRPTGQVAEISLEKIAARRPDQMVAQADLVGDTFDELNRIATTVTVALRSGDWWAGTGSWGWPPSGRRRPRRRSSRRRRQWRKRRPRWTTCPVARVGFRGQ